VLSWWYPVYFEWYSVYFEWYPVYFEWYPIYFEWYPVYFEWYPVYFLLVYMVRLTRIATTLWVKNMYLIVVFAEV